MLNINMFWNLLWFYAIFKIYNSIECTKLVNIPSENDHFVYQNTYRESQKVNWKCKQKKQLIFKDYLSPCKLWRVKLHLQELQETIPSFQPFIISWGFRFFTSVHLVNYFIKERLTFVEQIQFWNCI